MNLFAIILFIGINIILLRRYNYTIRNHNRSLVICAILIGSWLYCPINPIQLQSIVIAEGSFERVGFSQIWGIVSHSTNTTFVIREFYGLECQLFFSHPKLMEGRVIFTGHLVTENSRRVPSGRSRPINVYVYTIDLVSIRRA